ncbi:hypothetical protein NGM99_17130 [Mesorhizobium sp. RP14(2022)]|uniref:Uncharacterized protein n=1 Tax=Mesorhizobium liriopis TaxID=2953882 RepID=A0ABT1C9K0_9HYPH|nr:hypothetical protein [Mesorhizobium liriopis]MCO6051510.1 hypothetical protein [Mesorhizobium liriopis]
MTAANDNTPAHIRSAIVESMEWHWRHFYKVEGRSNELDAERDRRLIEKMRSAVILFG